MGPKTRWTTAAEDEHTKMNIPQTVAEVQRDHITLMIESKHDWSSLQGAKAERIAQLTRSAASSARSRAVSLNGLNRHSTAPCSSTRRRTLSSARAVMKTIGICCRRCVSSRWRSGPDMPGMAMSRIRQLVWPTLSDARNSSADENARTAKPNSLSKSGSDSRTDSSSSTTDTSERSTVTDSPRRSAHSSQQLSE
jgi:hypothetical protein